MKIFNADIKNAIDQRQGISLNFGAGRTTLPGYYSVDIVELPGIDIVADFNQPLDELPDNSVDAVHSRASFEHVKNFMGLMEEIHRICKPNADIKIIVPHFSNPYYYSDPTHVQPFGLYTMHYFMDEDMQPGRKVPSFYTSARFDLVSIRLQFYREKLVDKFIEPIISRLVNISINTQDIYERRFCYLYPAWQVIYQLHVKK